MQDPGVDRRGGERPGTPARDQQGDAGKGREHPQDARRAWIGGAQPVHRTALGALLLLLVAVDQRAAGGLDGSGRRIHRC